MQSETELTALFQANVDKIIETFIDTYGLKHGQEVTNLSDPLLRWLDFVTRYIPLRPRTVFLSNKFPKKLDADIEAALKNLASLIDNGSDINPYQSKGLILYNDTSATKRQQRTDLLWADWGIYHLHLATRPISSRQYFSERSEWLLFCMFGVDFACFIDVRNHGDENLFSDPDLIKTIADSWPEIMERYHVKDVFAPGKQHNSSEIASLRKGGVSSFVTIGNQVYMGPGMGVTTASTSTKASLAIVNVRRYIRKLATIVADPASQFRTESAASGIKNPEYSIVLTVRGLGVYEKNEDKVFLLPRGTNSKNRSFIVELHDLIAPEWAVRYMFAKSGGA